jgi:peptidoglycan/LPS O-acetylase OafA/YrhL
VLGKLTNNQSLGGIGLDIACLNSGYLITQSRANQQAAPYVVPRALRILPAPLLALPLKACPLSVSCTGSPRGLRSTSSPA